MGAAVACALEGTPPILLEVQSLVAPTDLAMPRRVGTGVDPKRLAMIVAVLSRHAGIALGQADVFVNVAGGVRIDEPGADLAIALAIASAARGAPVRERLGAFGEVGLTGRLRARRRRSGGSRSARSSGSPRARARGHAGRTVRTCSRPTRSAARSAPGSTAPEQGFFRKSLEKVAFSPKFVNIERFAGPQAWGRRFDDCDRKRGTACTRSATRWCIRTTGQARS